MPSQRVIPPHPTDSQSRHDDRYPLEGRVSVSINEDGTLNEDQVEAAVIAKGGPTGAEWSASQAAIYQGGTREFDVRAFGAVANATANGPVNSRAGCQAAINAAVAFGGGTVVIPPGYWKAQIDTPTTDVTPARDGEHCLVVNGDNITIRLLPGAVLDCYPYGGDPDTNWEVVGGEVWRGGGIFVTGGASYATRRRNVRVEGGEIRGNFTYTGNHGWPADTSTGDGWDITHKGIWYENDTYHDGHSVDGVHIHGWSGEVIYSGGDDQGDEPQLGEFSVTRCHVHDTNGSAVSLTARKMTVHYNHVHTAAGNGVENAAADGQQSIAHNHIHHTLLDAIACIGYGGGIGGFEAFSNDIHDCASFGIGCMSAWNSQVHHNKIRDCAQGGIRLAIGAGYPNDDMRDVDVFDNIVTAHLADMGIGVYHDLGPGQALRVRTQRNKIGRTAHAVTNGFGVAEPLSNHDTTDMGQVTIVDNEFDGIHGDTMASRIHEVLLTSTGEEYPANIRPSYYNGLFRASVSFRVAVGSTNVRVRVYYRDIDNASQYIEVQASTSFGIGTYTLPDVVVPCYRRGKVDVAVQAGTANQVYVSAVLEAA